MPASAPDRQPGRFRPPVPLTRRDHGPRPLLRTVLGEVLRRTRRAQSRTLADVAAASKISVPYLSEVERGRKEASSEVLAALSDALGVPLSRVLAEAGQDLAAALAERRRQERAAALRELRSIPARDLTPGPALALAPTTIRELAPSSGTLPAAGGEVMLLAA